MTVSVVAQQISDDDLMSKFAAQKAEVADTKLGAPRSMKPRGVSVFRAESEGDGAVAISADQSPPADPESFSATSEDYVWQFNDNLRHDIRIEFAYDSAAIDASQTEEIDQVCRVMQQMESLRTLRIAGHTDGRGDDAYNQNLSLLRAREVARYLTDPATCGIDAARIQTVGYGELLPINTEDPEAAENRRVEFQALS